MSDSAPRSDAEDMSSRRDMYVGHAINPEDSTSQLAIVDHRVHGFIGFDTVEEMASYVVSQFGRDYADHITYKPPIPPYDVLPARQLEQFVRAVNNLLKK